MKNTSRLFILICAVSLLSCSLKHQRYNIDGIKNHAKQKTQLYPSVFGFDIEFVEDYECVSRRHKEIYGTPINSIAFYSSVNDLIVVQKDCGIRVIRHEVGHALVQDYFKEPVPNWLHEFLARKCEED